jgi:ABC-type antimicrobial peptide transport system permease subunit
MPSSPRARAALVTLGVLLLFIVANILSTALLSDCGLSTLFGRRCADGIQRTGFPLQFFESGGFIAHTYFNMGALLIDVVVALVVSVAAGWLARRGASPLSPE